MLRTSILAVFCFLLLGPAPGVFAESIPDLVAWWAFDEGQGTVANDWSENGLNATVNGGATWVPGKSRTALQFNGTNAYVEAPHIPLNSRSFTITMWINPVLYAAAQVVFGQHQSGSANLSMHYRLGGPGGTGPNPGAVRMAFYSNDLNTAAGLIQDNTWYHLTFWYDSVAQTQRIYINGTQSAQRTAAPYLGTSGVTNIGRWHSGSAQWFRGMIDDVQIYHRALSNEEIQKIMTGLTDTSLAYAPEPKDKALSVSLPLLQWKAGEGALFHNVYVGTTPELTEANRVALNLPFAMHYLTTGLEAGVTYYWRVDEVKANGTVHPGPVWSFTTTPKTAWAPTPTDGAQYVAATGKLAWTAGINALTHDVYLGPDRAAVEAGAAETKKATGQVPASFDVAGLERGKTYYWRVDEVLSDGTRVAGPIWSFTVRPVIAKADPTLVGWWKLDDEKAGAAVDYSGYDNYGTLVGPRFVEGQFGEALSFDGMDDYVDCGNDPSLNIRDRITIACWIKVASFSKSWETILSKGDNSYRLSRSSTTTAAGTSVHFGCNGPTGGNLDGVTIVTDNNWHHVALVYDGTNKIIYIDGREDARVASTGQINESTHPVFIGENAQQRGRQLKGLVDDVRIYNTALTPEQIRKVMQGDPLQAWNPQPGPGANVDIRDTTSLTWSAGDQAARHDVYFGKEKDAVKVADTASELYQGRQAGTSFSLAGQVELGGGTYFWRIDEVEADGTTIHKGSVWSFTIPGYLLVDEFENYTDDEGNRIYETWVDGWTNNTGSVVGYLQAPFAERTIVHSGKQAMPLEYNNIKSPFYSEAEQTFAPLQDWTGYGVTNLSLWFRGNLVRYVDKGNGAFSVGGSGTDIWGNADDFRFVYKRLSGNASIIVKLDSIANTNAWAKGGVMIRETLEAGSKFAYVVSTPAQGVSFGWRNVTNAACDSMTQAGLPTTQWVKLTRTGDVFTAQYSANGTTWTDIKNADGTTTATTITMLGSVYIGLCVTSHNAAAATTAQFSGAATTGGVTGAWQEVWIGDDPDLTNGAAGLYVVVEDSTGKSAVATHSDPLAANLSAWTEWKIPLSSLTGVNLARVKKLSIGVGDKKAPVPGASGRIYIDDIRLIK